MLFGFTTLIVADVFMYNSFNNMHKSFLSLLKIGVPFSPNEVPFSPKCGAVFACTQTSVVSGTRNYGRINQRRI